MLIRTNMEDLRDTTHSKHYEVYRKDRLKEMGFTDNEGKPGNFAEQYNMRRENHLSTLQQKEEEMRQKFVIRVKEKEAELKESEKEVRIGFCFLKLQIFYACIKIYEISNTIPIFTLNRFNSLI